ncbi:UBE3C [Cordylochernes scorpioides]|uniref:HECT-type E3 ubiquitin transferase n=1 Tax=Cordylochernes scorpioides TaxID=51811 RepID=A0ABY6K257_9ARAC|nr:UBE3C [Cordylochernes scorpioides]
MPKNEKYLCLCCCHANLWEVPPPTFNGCEEDEGPPMTSGEVRHLTVLRELPFVLPFHTRVNILQSLLDIDRQENQHNAEFGLGPRIHLAIRRNYIYEDAYNKLSQENGRSDNLLLDYTPCIAALLSLSQEHVCALEPNPKLMIRVKLINTMGLDEPGIDGGGIFREFLGELLKTAFDPTRGFFVATTDQLLYPNPAVHLLMPDFPKHYYFIGRMLGKAMYENMLLELPLADFFLAKLLNARGSNVDVHHLASLDPMIYKNLLSLKTYEGDVADLGLDFTAISSGLGESKVFISFIYNKIKIKQLVDLCVIVQLVELKPGGANIPVTEDNRIEYIHLMADYKLNRQIRAQTQAFKEGMASVIDLSWLRMFNYSELQTLISGAHVPVDVEDLRAHAVYNGGYTAEHPTILAFWSTVESFSETQRRQLLRFVTSCSRPPLLGFRELHPNFCIQRAGDVDRLPTASTCMNLLKLPEFQDQQTLREKLLYAIESGAGFELS